MYFQVKKLQGNMLTVKKIARNGQEFKENDQGKSRIEEKLEELKENIDFVE